MGVDVDEAGRDHASAGIEHLRIASLDCGCHLHDGVAAHADVASKPRVPVPSTIRALRITNRTRGAARSLSRRIPGEQWRAGRRVSMSIATTFKTRTPDGQWVWHNVPRSCEETHESHIRSSRVFAAFVHRASGRADSGRSEGPCRRGQYLEDTRQAVLNSIGTSPPAQWTFKATPTSWSSPKPPSISDIEDTIFGMIATQMMQAPAPPPGAGVPDDKVIAGVTDRTSKFQAPEVLKPVNKWATKEALIKDFNAARDKSIAWVKTTTEDLRAHASPHPAFGSMDAHQWVLLLAGHSARHTAQIEEVKTAAGYPK